MGQCGNKVRELEKPGSSENSEEPGSQSTPYIKTKMGAMCQSFECCALVTPALAWTSLEHSGWREQGESWEPQNESYRPL